MAKSKTEESAEQAPWRTVALCRRVQTIAYPTGIQRYVGGELEEMPARVEVLRPCEHWSFVDVDGPEQLEDLRASLAAEVEDLRARAANLGYELVASGTKPV